MSENNSNFIVTAGSERSFGIVFSVFFLIISLYPYLVNGSNIILPLVILSIFFALVAYLIPRALRIPNVLWFKFGMFLGSFMAPIAMLIIYIFVFTPYGLTLKILRIDLLDRKFNHKTNTYWKEKKDSVNSFKNQF